MTNVFGFMYISNHQSINEHFIFPALFLNCLMHFNT